MPLPRFPLKNVLAREGNNLGLARLLAAALVLYNGAFATTGAPAHVWIKWDPALRLLGYDGFFAASVGNHIFFFLAGLLATHSLLRREDPVSFIVARTARVWPALAAVVLATTLVIGPLCSNLSAREYFHHPATWLYCFQNLLLQVNNYLPGVFTANAGLPHVNPPLWAPAYVVCASAIILALFAFSLLQRRWLSLVVLALLFLDPLLPRPLFLFWQQNHPENTYLPASFAWGAMFAVSRANIMLTPRLLVILLAVFLVLKRTILGPHAFLLLFFVTLLYVCALPAVRRCRLNFDPAYGMYLWGFLIQQVIAQQLPGLGWAYSLAMSLPLAFAVGWLSWRWIERPAIGFAARVAARRESLVLSS